MLVVPDATQDFRFKDNPLVTDGLKIRFYAGAALVSKEGYKLGTLCIISPIARPHGLNSEQQAMLHEMAGMVVGTMDARRNRLLKDEYEVKFHHLARTFLDTTHHLEDARNGIEKVLAHGAWGTDQGDYEALSSVAHTLDMQSKMCTAAMRTALQDTPSHNMRSKPSVDEDDGCLDDNETEDFDQADNCTTNMKKLFDNVNAIVGSFPRQDAVTVEIDKSVPRVIGCDDLLLFRAVLNMLTHCMGASKDGEACGIRIRRMKRADDELLVQCLLGGKPVTKQYAKSLFEHRESLLSPVASIVRSMGGHYGMYEARWDPRNSKSAVQSIFWFQIPYVKPEKVEVFHRTLLKTHAKPDQGAVDAAVDKAVEDPFHKALLQSGCGQLSSGKYSTLVQN
jgi:hypothetical protein